MRFSADKSTSKSPARRSASRLKTSDLSVSCLRAAPDRCACLLADSAASKAQRSDSSARSVAAETKAWTLKRFETTRACSSAETAPWNEDCARLRASASRRASSHCDLASCSSSSTSSRRLEAAFAAAAKPLSAVLCSATKRSSASARRRFSSVSNAAARCWAALRSLALAPSRSPAVCSATASFCSSLTTAAAADAEDAEANRSCDSTVSI
mmetsp:Transcript_7252/g.23627  ORF Transcript_7252/g.23627 Transcript_7252/m.23627 type:complete len:212 (+) Transcript_7252:1100-1735(+)